jgi:hypothetical protein
LKFLRALKETQLESAMPALVAESTLAKDWLAPEEEEAWGDLCPMPQLSV